MEQGDQALGEFLEEKDETKKGELRQVSFAHYEAAYNRYEESRDSAAQSREIALASKSELKQSARYVEEDLNTAETYLGGPNDSTRKERDSLAIAYQDIDNNELKKANEIIQNSRANARTILAASIQSYARERNLTATEVVEDANSRFEDIKEADVQNPESLKTSYESARENLGAANESLASAGNLYSQEKYEDSIRQSEEAIRLGEIVIEETSGLTPDAIAKKRGTIASNTTDTKSSSKTSKSSPLKEGWSKYTVKSSKPEDCLWRIAGKKEFYGNAKLWPRIYEANKDKIKNKNLIYPNQVLYIPPQSGKIVSPFEESPTKEESSPSLDSKPETAPSDTNQINSGKPVNGPDEEVDEPEDAEDDEILQEEDIDEEK
jgi:nucleoid-associated protein YgaU